MKNYKSLQEAKHRGILLLKRRFFRFPWLLSMTLLLIPKILFADMELSSPTHTKVAVREHPRTGKPFVSITEAGMSENDPFLKMTKIMKRPDYRMLDPKVKSGQIPYEGPVSDRKKVYILAATLATVGTVGGSAIIAAAPAATGAGAAGGAGLYAGAGAGVAAGTLGGSLAASRQDAERVNFTHVLESHAVNTQNSANQKKT